MNPELAPTMLPRPAAYHSHMSATSATPARAFVHSSADIDADARIGAGTRIWHFTHVGNATIGERCTLGQNVFVAAGVSIGNNVKIQNNVSVYGGVTLEDDVFCGPSMVFTNVSTPRSAFPRKRRKTIVQRWSGGALRSARTRRSCAVVRSVSMRSSPPERS